MFTDGEQNSSQACDTDQDQGTPGTVTYKWSPNQTTSVSVIACGPGWSDCSEPSYGPYSPAGGGSSNPPTISLSAPSYQNQTVSAPSGSFDFAINTNETATCKIDYYNFGSYSGLRYSMNDAGTYHDLVLSLSPGQSYTEYVACADSSNNASAVMAISFSVQAVADNPPSVVNITAPTAGQPFTAGANIPITVTATDPDSGDYVARVDFYNQNAMLGSVSGTGQTQFTLNSWTNVPAGNYTLTAYAYDTHNESKASAQVAITVSAGGSPILIDTSKVPTTGAAGQAYTGSVTATGGSGGFIYTENGAPSWFNLASNGTITGTPELTNNTFTVSITARDSSNHTASQNVTVNILYSASDANGSITASATPASGSAGSVTFSATQSNGYRVCLYVQFYDGTAGAAGTMVPAGGALCAAGTVTLPAWAPTTGAPGTVVAYIDDPSINDSWNEFYELNIGPYTPVQPAGTPPKGDYVMPGPSTNGSLVVTFNNGANSPLSWSIYNIYYSYNNGSPPSPTTPQFQGYGAPTLDFTNLGQFSGTYSFFLNDANIATSASATNVWPSNASEGSTTNWYGPYTTHMPSITMSLTPTNGSVVQVSSGNTIAAAWTDTAYENFAFALNDTAHLSVKYAWFPSGNPFANGGSGNIDDTCVSGTPYTSGTTINALAAGYTNASVYIGVCVTDTAGLGPKWEGVWQYWLNTNAPSVNLISNTSTAYAATNFYNANVTNQIVNGLAVQVPAGNAACPG